MICYNGFSVENAVIAQMVERILGKDEVAGSIPANSSKQKSVHFRERIFVYIIHYLLKKRIFE